MAVKEIKDMGASVLSRLKKQAKESGINYQTCLQLFAQEEFLRKLEMSGYADNLVLKGEMYEEKRRYQGAAPSIPELNEVYDFGE